MTTPRLTLGSLFSGIGGFELGFERAGYDIRWQVEIDPWARAVLAKHWPHVYRHDDIRTAGAHNLETVDVLCGGFPCQDISTAGKGAGIADGTRSGLWSEYARLIRELRPSYVVVENVSALLVRGFDRVLGDLAACGYDCEWDCIPAAAVGAPHRRDRIWLVAYPDANGWRQRVGSELYGHTASHPTDRHTRWRYVGGLGHEVPAAADVANAGSQRQQPIAGSMDEREAAQGSWVHPSAHGRREDVADTWGERGQLSTERHQSAITVLGGRDAARSLGQWRQFWAVEPGVGRGFDGLPLWLDRCVGWKMSHAASARAGEALRRVWSPHVSQTLRRAIGGLTRMEQAQVLFAFVREYEVGAHEARLLVAGQEASEAFLRGLRQHALSSSAPRRSRQGEQSGREHPDALQVLPRLLAFDRPPHWAGDGWEDATPRVATGVPGRVDRLRGLGNSIVPQIAEWIAHRISAAEARRIVA